MEMHFLSAGYEHHLPPTTSAHFDQRPQMSSKLPHSTDDTHLVAQDVELSPAASSAGHLLHKKAFKTTVICKEKHLSFKTMVVAA